MPGIAVAGGVGGLLRAVAAADPVGGPDAQRAAREELRRGEYHRDDPGLVEPLPRLGGPPRRLALQRLAPAAMPC